ncbi:MAG: alpha/beta hydrolase [Defluviicoccus sp.]|nr:alpha/beta hydrolase [Defluviicoccus sp.]MDE0386031.1 alpha/beta hydrolase [Defluviicoccus sp.]
MNADGCETAAILTRPGGATIAYRRLAGCEPGVMFLGGFRSDMTGTKATMLEAACREAGRGFVRFDYSGHGESSGDFLDGTIGSWRDDALAVLDEAAQGRQVLVGSSMGGWIMLLAALARPERVAGLVGIAAAPDFTEELMWNRYGADMRAELRERGVIHLPSDYDDRDYPIAYGLIEEGRRHLLLHRPIAIHCPVRLLHGKRDADVPWTTAPRIAEKLLSRDVRVFLVPDGDHRLSRDEDLARLRALVDELCGAAES